MNRRKVAWFLAILAFFIFVGSPLKQTAEAVVGVDDAIIAIVIAALAAMGISFVVSASYGSLEEYVGSLMQEYAASRGTTVNQMFSGAQTGSNRLGQLLLNNRFVQVVSTFAIWLRAKFSLTNNSTKNVVSSNTTWGGLTVYRMPFVVVHNSGNPQYEHIVYRSSGSPVYVIMKDIAGTLAQPMFVSTSEAQIQRITYNNGNITEDGPLTLAYSDYYHVYYVDGPSYPYSAYNDLASLEYYSVSEIGAALTGQIEEGGASIDIITGTMSFPTEDPDYDGEGAVLDLDAPWGLGYDDITDVLIPGEFADGDAGDVTIDYQDQQAIEEQVEDTPSSSVSQNADEYQVVGLSQVFPFCIPFDIYNFFSCLAADPVAPSFQWRFYVPDICDETITVDLSQFNAVAQIVRTMELLAFIVGLALITRDKILRG